MTQSTKTISFAAAAAVLVLLAFVMRPKTPYAPKEGEVGQLLFKDWKDPTAAKSMEITVLDELQPDLPPFKVALVDGKWCIPSHDNYPANAQEHVVKVATDLINLKILGVVSDAPGSHETYGVVDPDKSKLKGLPVGVGKLVVVKDKDGKPLARLIIGKEDKSPAGGASDLRFVRRAGQDRVYKVALPTDLFTTKFADWIDPDLLGLKQHWDITKMQVRDYGLSEQGDEIGVVRKNDIDLATNATGGWIVKQLTDFHDGKPVVTKLPPGDELDTTKLNDAKMDLSGLKMIDVSRKPAKLAEKLKAHQNFLDDPDAVASLARQGFIALPEKKPTDIFSGGGDMTVTMKDGVIYTIRFGGVGLTVHEKDESTAKKPGKSQSGRSSAERVVFVTAHFDPSLIAKPALTPLPGAKTPEKPKPSEKTPDKNGSSGKPAAGKTPETKNAISTSPETKTPETKTPETKTPETKTPETKTPEAKSPAAKSPAAKTPAAKKDDAKKSALAKRPEVLLALADEPPLPAAKPAVDSKPGDSKPVEAKNSDKKPDADAKTPESAKVPETAKTPVTAKGAANVKPAETAKSDKAPSKPAATTTPAQSGKPAASEKKPLNDLQRADEEKARDELHKQIEAANKHATDDYKAALKKGRDHAKQLNDRFADWYYFISEDDYKKVHLTRANLIKPKAASEDTPPAGLAPHPTDPFHAIPGG